MLSVAKCEGGCHIYGAGYRIHELQTQVTQLIEVMLTKCVGAPPLLRIPGNYVIIFQFTFLF